MSRYLLIESRDPFDSGDAERFYAMASDLRRAGHDVTLFLVQNGVLPARPCARSAALTALADSGVQVLADDFSLDERGIARDGLATGIAAAPLDTVVDGLAAGDKTIWH